MSADIFRPFRPWVWIVPLPLIAVASWLLAQPPSASYDLWVRASASIHDSLAISGPLMLVWSALLSAGATGRAWVFAAVPGPIRVRQHLRFVGVTTALALVAHLVGIAPRLVFAAQTATSGSVSIPGIITAVAWVAIFCAVGVACGHVLSHPRWLLPLPPLVAIVMFMPVVYDRAWAILLPNKQWQVDPRGYLSTGVTVMVVALAAAILAATVLVVGRDAGPAVRVGPMLLRRPSVGLVTGLVAAVALVGASFVYRPEIYLLGAPVEPVCRIVDVSTVCLHPAVVDSFPQVEELVQQLERVGLDRYAPQITDSNLDPNRYTTPGELMIGVDPARSVATMTRNAVYDLLTSQCNWEVEAVYQEDTSPFAVAQGLATATLTQLGEPKPEPFTVADERISRLSADELATLLRNQQQLVVSCSLPAADIP